MAWRRKKLLPEDRNKLARNRRLAWKAEQSEPAMKLREMKRVRIEEAKRKKLLQLENTAETSAAFGELLAEIDSEKTAVAGLRPDEQYRHVRKTLDNPDSELNKKLRKLNSAVKKVNRKRHRYEDRLMVLTMENFGEMLGDLR